VRKLGEGGLMVRVRWSDEAEADLETIKPAAVRDQLRNNAGEILHPISRWADPADEGVEDGIMWHRGDGHGRFTRQPEGPQDYFLIYRRCGPAPGSEDPEFEDPEEDLEFEVLAVCSIRQVASIWLRMGDAEVQSLPGYIFPAAPRPRPQL
jgi:hypothetical protein